ncbi:hypothetical protein CPB86DRAFT_805581 [Serendipita vermifera]|nr:hypothetical protein CPB86DRAFT_805581 [Serendipita vermifera]
MPQFTLEVCVDSLASARAAVQAGANRLEVCSTLAMGGGLTPSLGLVQSIRDAYPNTPLMITIRPRCGDFVYSEDEMDVMLRDIYVFKSVDVYGVVFGVLEPDGGVDVTKTTQLVRAAEPMQVTFHRAFDTSRDIDDSLSRVKAIPGISRILTSGGELTVTEALPQIARLFRNAAGTPVVMPGSGINSTSIGIIATELLPFGLSEVHMSGGEWVEGTAKWKKTGMGMGVTEGKAWNIWKSSFDKISAVRQALDSISML